MAEVTPNMLDQLIVWWMEEHWIISALLTSFWNAIYWYWKGLIIWPTFVMIAGFLLKALLSSGRSK